MFGSCIIIIMHASEFIIHIIHNRGHILQFQEILVIMSFNYKEDYYNKLCLFCITDSENLINVQMIS